MPHPSPPAKPDTPDPSAPLRRNHLRIALQVAGFALGIALFGWVVRTALGEMTPERWDQLRSASLVAVAGMFLLALGNVALNGLMWFVAFLPIRRLRLPDMLAVNAGATTLAYLPFKLSILFRVLYHKRFDAIPVLQFGGWTAAITACMAAALLPGIGASLLPTRDDTVPWLAITLVGALLCALAGARLSAFFATGKGWRWLKATIIRITGDRGRTVVESTLFENLHSGVHMLADTRATLSGVALRLLDAAFIAARFAIAAQVLGIDLMLVDALVVGVAYFLIGAVAPTGTVGVREGGTAGLFALLGLEDMTAVIVFVSALEMLANITAGLAAGAWLGPAKLGKLRKDAETAEESGALAPDHT